MADPTRLTAALEEGCLPALSICDHRGMLKMQRCIKQNLEPWESYSHTLHKSDFFIPGFLFSCTIISTLLCPLRQRKDPAKARDVILIPPSG